ncbi:malto-oligosyltrehalose synthase [Deminuibacter soli]|uniref:Malto-oligosyltrehalose synthase n=1 Tax=Deminuibacter soli TaxID=2291815 RepID=A0A3E1NQZ1_9BACT|nr:malto-oligosyltrehalose synthase [Deminuibacter soli]RFM30343.1 malto-oligosyltrehalose synthase [Deminuibacter soli]
MKVPIATYRVQLHSGFTFRDLKQILPYLKQLGISTIYASPITTAVKGSMHGYDVTDPLVINPEIGTRQELEEINGQLKAYNMSWLQDIVPNHMAFSSDNARLNDVLERGGHSAYHRFFDINWHHPNPEICGKLMVPFLGSNAEEAVDKKEIQLQWLHNKCVVKYFDNVYPLSFPAYRILQSYASSGPQQGIDYLNSHPDALKHLLQQQFYLLSWWKKAELQMNYRRFFTVNSLICLRMEDKAVFDEYHPLIIDLYKKGLIQGVRIDHIDGLYNPAAYVEQLRKALGDDAYIIAEKILEYSEQLPRNWALQGTSGYEFLAFTAQLLTNKKGSAELCTFYQSLVPATPAYNDMVFEKKHHFLLDQMNGELDNLLGLAATLQLVKEEDDTEELKEALGMWMAAFPVYRIYPDAFPLDAASQQLMDIAMERAQPKAPSLQHGWKLLQAILTPEGNAQDGPKLLFLKRLMQFTGPLAAKGVEDTTFYVYNPLIAHNEVGDSPAQLGISIEDFHSKMKARQQHTPLSINTSSTHDTKRGEDARMRIAVLSEHAAEWIKAVTHWQQVNEPLLQVVNGKRAPSANDEYFIYQSLIGSFPQSLQCDETFRERMHAFMIKALREAKVETNYGEPNTAYEDACIEFIDGLLNPGHAFLQHFVGFLDGLLDDAGQFSLVQTAIKLTAPGIPDIYQGCELWDHSLVDPDNRRPIDYEVRRQLLEALKEKEHVAAALEWAAENKRLGAQKLYLIKQLLGLRNANTQLFSTGEYIPLEVSRERIAVAYARILQPRWVITVARMGIGEDIEDVQLQLPWNRPSHWQNILTGETVQAENNTIQLQDLLRHFPVAVLVGS